MQTVILQFETRMNGKSEPVDYVLLAPLDDQMKTRTWQPVRKLEPKMPADDMSSRALAMRARWGFIEPAYEAWKKGTEISEDGIPLEAWAGIEKFAIDALREHRIRTVEQLAEAPLSLMDKLKVPNSSKLPGMAQTYLESQAGTELAGVVEAQATQLEEQRRQMEEMKQLMAELQKPKRGPGRPPKTEAA